MFTYQLLFDSRYINKCNGRFFRIPLSRRRPPTARRGSVPACDALRPDRRRQAHSPRCRHRPQQPRGPPPHGYRRAMRSAAREQVLDHRTRVSAVSPAELGDTRKIAGVQQKKIQLERKPGSIQGHRQVVHDRLNDVVLRQRARDSVAKILGDLGGPLVVAGEERLLQTGKLGVERPARVAGRCAHIIDSWYAQNLCRRKLPALPPASWPASPRGVWSLARPLASRACDHSVNGPI